MKYDHKNYVTRMEIISKPGVGALKITSINHASNRAITGGAYKWPSEQNRLIHLPAICLHRPDQDGYPCELIGQLCHTYEIAGYDFARTMTHPSHVLFTLLQRFDRAHVVLSRDETDQLWDLCFRFWDTPAPADCSCDGEGCDLCDAEERIA